MSTLERDHARGLLAGVAMARSVRDVVMQNAAEAERLRTLPPAVVRALWSSGLMRWMNPVEAGGSAPSMREMIEAWKELAWQDGSLGWIAIANFPSAAFAAAYLPDEGFAEVFTHNDCNVTVAGQFFPNGIGEEESGGYRLTGSWQFGSGTGHSDYVACGFMPAKNGIVHMADEMLPQMLVAVVPRAQVTFTDGWHVQGLKGTGSYDYNVQGVFVPASRTYPLFTTEPRRGGRIFTLGLMPQVAAGHAAWALGVSRSMLDDTIALAKDKVRMGELTSLANKPTFQRGLAHHEAMWRGADLLVGSTFTSVTDAVLAGAELTLAMRAELRMAATYATEASRTIVEWCHLACGTTAIREGSRLERAFRDMYTGSQHAFISEKTYIDAAQVLLGLTDKVPGL
jgi:alkylation response protein AidB-like acyl-CoA dehydrogenase